jgi:hypothetical protein
MPLCSDFSFPEISIQSADIVSENVLVYLSEVGKQTAENQPKRRKAEFTVSPCSKPQLQAEIFCSANNTRSVCLSTSRQRQK